MTHRITGMPFMGEDVHKLESRVIVVTSLTSVIITSKKNLGYSCTPVSKKNWVFLFDDLVYST